MLRAVTSHVLAARGLLAAAALLCVVQPARAQYQPYEVPEPATGETYHVEAGFYLWLSSPEMLVASESLGIPGTDIDLVNDLGMEGRRLKEFRLVLQPGRKHKFRFSWIPATFEGSTVLTRTIVFNGIRFDLNIPVDSQLKWNNYRFGYEYDIVSRDRGFFGLTFGALYTDIELRLASFFNDEFARARGFIPNGGAIGRVYVVSNISITGEVGAIYLPAAFEQDVDISGIDIDIYGTVNFTNNFGAQIGYRHFSATYTGAADRGDLKMKGVYFGGVARF